MKLVIFLFLLLPISIMASDKMKSVKVFGECSKKLQTDRGSITVTVTNSNTDIKKATWETNDKYNKFKALIVAMDLKDKEIETTAYNVFEKKEWVKDKYVSKGFTAEAGLKISTSEISRLGEVIATANKLQIENIGALNSFVSKTLQTKEYTNCLSIASKNALEKAKQLASTLNATVGDVIFINEYAGSNDRPHPQPRHQAKMMMMESAPSPDIVGASLDFELKVDVEFELK